MTTTVGSLADAQRLARELVARNLAACVQVEPGLTSFYVWDGKSCEEPEVRLTIKTMPGYEEQLRDFFAEHHPYKLPQFLATSMRASEDYGRWVHDRFVDY